MFAMNKLLITDFSTTKAKFTYPPTTQTHKPVFSATSTKLQHHTALLSVSHNQTLSTNMSFLLLRNTYANT